ncbi:hypothetical protein L7F22_033970 [Adiantum nelumboides]|nr:hypothetical protein [Adiantum nelumboides]
MKASRRPRSSTDVLRPWSSSSKEPWSLDGRSQDNMPRPQRRSSVWKRRSSCSNRRSLTLSANKEADSTTLEAAAAAGLAGTAGAGGILAALESRWGKWRDAFEKDWAKEKSQIDEDRRALQRVVQLWDSLNGEVEDVLEGQASSSSTDTSLDEDGVGGPLDREGSSAAVSIPDAESKLSSAARKRRKRRAAAAKTRSDDRATSSAEADIRSSLLDGDVARMNRELRALLYTDDFNLLAREANLDSSTSAASGPLSQQESRSASASSSSVGTRGAGTPTQTSLDSLLDHSSRRGPAFLSAKRGGGGGARDGHPFAAGLTLAEFSAVSTDKDWKPTFVQNSAEGIHKLARLESLAAYWDTDADSLAGHELSKAQQLFNDLIAREGQIPDHQFILKPVSGAGRLVMRRKMTNDIPKMDAQLLFDQLGQAQYRRFRPAVEELEENRPRAMLHFAGRAILNEVHEKHKVWSWDYFRQRRDDRRDYVRLFMEKEKQANKANQNQAGVVTAQSEEGEPLKDLEKRLSYKDIRFYRSIARNELRKEKIAQRKDEIANGHSNQAGGSSSAGGGWLGWIWGGGGGGHAEGSNQGGVLNDEQRKELYDAIEWDEESGSTAIGQALDLPGDAMKLRLTTKLQTGSFALHDHSKGNEIISLVFDSLQADVIQRIDNLEAALSLGGLRVYDGTSPQSLYPQIVRVKDDELGMPKGRQNSAGSDLEQVEKEVGEESDPDNPFFALRFENKPLDKRADNALSLKMRSLEIIYHRGYVEEIVRFFKPPESELELIGALIDVASETLEGIRKETRTGLEHALETHKTIDLDMDVKAPIIIVPEDVTKKECQHIVLDAGKISLKSVLADQGALDTVRSKQSKQYTEEDYRQLEDLMYDRFFVKLESAQLVMGPDLASCMKSLHADSEHDHAFHLLERINLDFTLHNSILPKAPNLTKFKMTGHLPSLRVNFSDRKYKTLMAIIDVAIPQLGDSDSSKANSRAGTIMELSEVEEEEEPEEEQGRKLGRHSSQPSETFNLSRERRSRIASQMRGDEYVVEPASEDVEDDQAEFQDAEDATADRINAHQKNFELHFVVDRLSGSIYKSNTDPLKPDRLLVEAVFEGFLLHLAVYPYHLDVDVGLRSLELEDKIVDQGAVFKHLITSKQVDDGATKGGTVSTETEPKTPPSDKDLVRVKYTRVQTDSPEFMSVYEGIDQTINVDVSTINIMLTRVSVLAVYDWIMTTFVPAQEDQVQHPSQQGEKARRQSDASKTNRRISIDGPPKDDKNLVKDGSPGTVEERKEKIRVRVKLTSVVLRLNNDGELLATLTLSTADVAVLLRGNTLRVAARLGSLLLLDNSQRQTSNPEFKKLLSLRR